MKTCGINGCDHVEDDGRRLRGHRASVHGIKHVRTEGVPRQPDAATPQERLVCGLDGCTETFANAFRRTLHRRAKHVENPGEYAVSHSRSMPANSPANNVDAEPVPASAIGLPWTRYPRDPQTARVLAEFMKQAATAAPIRALGTEAVAFYESQAAYLRALADRVDAHPDRRKSA